MDDELFFRFTRDLYDAELEVPERILKRIPLAVSGIVIIGGFVGFLTDLEYVRAADGGTCVILVLYYCSAIAAIILLVLAAFSVFKALPARQYQRIKPASHWERWRRRYAKQIRTSYDRYSDEEVQEMVAVGLRNTMASQMMSLTEYNRSINEGRFYWANHALGYAVWSLVPVAAEGLGRLTLLLLHLAHA